MELRLLIGLIFVFLRWLGGVSAYLIDFILDAKILNTGTTDFSSKMESLIPYSWLLTCHGLKILLGIM